MGSTVFMELGLKKGVRGGEAGERATTGCEPFDMHAPLHWIILGYVMKSP